MLAEAASRLGNGAEARWIIEESSGLEGPALVLALDDEVPARGVAACLAMMARRRAGEPVQYVVGRWAFRTLDLMVDRRVLIPRPETEQVVEVAREELARLARLGRLGRLVGSGPAITEREVVDLGTGSGAIALSLAVEDPSLSVWATDVSAEALAVARANLAGLGGRAATRVRLVEGSWYRALPDSLAGRVCLVVSNPPYVAEDEVADLPPEVARWEPARALVSGPSGLEGVQAVLDGARAFLGRPGTVVVELAPHQAGAAVDRARRAGFADVEVRPDLAGRPRALVARA